MNNFLILQQNNKVLGLIFYDDKDRYVLHRTANCGCSARSYIEDVLAGMTLPQTLKRLEISNAMMPLVVGYVGDAEEVSEGFL